MGQAKNELIKIEEGWGEDGVWSLMCSEGHNVEVDADDLIEVLEDERVCSECKSEFVSLHPDRIHLEAPCCHELSCTFGEAKSVFWENRCAACESVYGEELNSAANFSIPGTFDHACKAYEWSLTHKTSTRNMLRPNRDDYWEFLVHYTNRDELISIGLDRSIKACKTGYLSISAVCLTETPHAHSAEIRKRHGDFGIVFKKSDIIKYGGAPVIHLTKSQLKKNANGFPADLKFLLSKLEIPQKGIGHNYFDFLFEREWRIGTDINFSIIKPFGFIFPDTNAFQKFKGDKWEVLMELATSYGDIFSPLRD